MRMGRFTGFLVKAVPKGRRVLAIGAPGIGKTYGFRGAAKWLGWESIFSSAPLLNPVKIGGYPVAPKSEGGDATHAMFDGFARAMRATVPTLFVIDDLGMANGETLKCLLDWVQFGRIDGRQLPDCVTVCAASNDVGHGADVMGLIEPLKSRWNTIIHVETNIDDVVVYGLSHGWPSDLIAYLRNAPDALHDWKPSKNMSINGACPRGWDYVAQWINDGIDDDEVISGCVGKGRATAYLAFRQLIGQLPDIDSVIMNPETEIVPENPSARFLVACALSSKMTAGNLGACMKYLKRLPAMFRAFSIRDAFRAESARKIDGSLPKGWQALASSRDFSAWAVSEDGKAVMSAA